MDTGRIKSIGSYLHLKESGALDWMSDSGSDKDEADDFAESEVSPYAIGEEGCDILNERGTLGAMSNYSTHHLKGTLSSAASSSVEVRLLEIHSHDQTRQDCAATIELETGEIVDSSEQEGGVVGGHRAQQYQSVSTSDARETPVDKENDAEEDEEEEEEAALYEKDKKEDPNVGGITVAEDRTEGQVTLATYLKYFESMGGVLLSALWLLLMSCGQVKRTMVLQKEYAYVVF